MKTSIYALIGLLCAPWTGISADTPRTDINPVLQYWQAFAVMPDLTPEDQKYLLETQWRTRPMDNRAGELVSRYDNTFKLLRAAAGSSAECDWGLDLSLGPQVLLPHLAKVKRCAVVSALRARWALQQNRPQDAAEDLVAAFVLARNASRDKTLIGALVQIAAERIILSFVIQEWPSLSKETIRALLAGFDRAPARGTIAACIASERIGFYEWLLRNIDQLQKANAGDNEKLMQELSKLLSGMDADLEGQPQRADFGPRVLQAAGGTVAGLVTYVQQLEPLYGELDQLMVLPYAEFQPAIEAFQERLAANTNLLVQEVIAPLATRVREKEFKVLAWLAMVHTAYQIRLDPVHGLQAIDDPFGSGPFGYSRFVQEGVDRGFQLKSQLRNPDFPEVLIFAEKTGPAFLVDGPFAGKKVQ